MLSDIAVSHSKGILASSRARGEVDTDANKDFFHGERWLCIEPGCEDEGVGLFSNMHGRLKPQRRTDIQDCVCVCLCH